MRRWGSITEYPGGWRARSGNETRSQIGIFLAVEYGGDLKLARAAAEEALEEAYKAWRSQRAPKGRGAILVAYGRKLLERWEREKTRAGLKQDVNRFNRHIASAPFAEDPIPSIEHRQIQRWVRRLASEHVRARGGEDTQPRDRETVKKIRNLLSTIFRHAIEDEIIDENPCFGIVIPKSTKVVEEFLLLEEAELELVLTAQPSEFVSLKQITAFIVAAITGMRPGEVWGLRWDDVPAGAGELLTVRHNRDRATKGGRVRKIPLLEPAWLALERWRIRPRARGAPRGDELVFPTRSGRPFGEGYDAGWAPSQQRLGGKKDGYRYTTTGARWRIGIRRRVPLKDLRHTCACALLRGWWVKRGWISRPLSMLEVSQWLGHQSLTTTERHYAKLAPGGLLDVVPARRS